jgi:hypothetical protein
MSVEEIVNIRPQLGMIFVLYYHEESKSSDNEYNCRIDRVKVAELIEHINQNMTLHASSFEVANDMINIDAMTKLIIISIQAYLTHKSFLKFSTSTDATSKSMMLGCRIGLRRGT